MEAEKQKAESGTLHQEKTLIFHAAESKVNKYSFVKKKTITLLSVNCIIILRYNF